MTRAISLAVFAALVAGLFLIPPADPVRLAATGAGDLLREEAAVDGGGGPAELWRFLRDGPCTELRADGTYEVRIRGSRMRVLGGTVDDEILHELARQSVVRELRAIASESDTRFPLEVVFRPRKDFPGTDLEVLLGAGTLELTVRQPDGTAATAGRDYSAPSQLSLLPPLIAIFLAILFRAPVLALAAGVLSGAFLTRWLVDQGAAEAAAGAALDLGRVYFWNELVKTMRIELILFVVFMLAMVGVITRAGGIQGLMNRIAGLARDLRRTQVATWLMGLVVFFDDYANTILVGSTMRPLADRYRMAREKLAYIVDSTAAPVAGISIFSTWIAFEVSTFSAQLPDAGLSPSEGYRVFVQTLPYRFYCILTLFLVGLLVFTGRSFGPMLKAERRAATGKLLRDGAKPMVGKKATELRAAEHVQARARVALLPLGTFIAVTVAFMMYAGGAFSGEASLATVQGWNKVLEAGGGTRPLMVGSAAGLVLAAVLAWGEGLSRQILSAAWASVRSMVIAIVILYLAWMIGAVCDDLGTASYLSMLVSEALPPILLPLLLFVLAAVVAFSTGSSWSTMTILLPIVVGLAYTLGEAGPMGGLALLVISIGAVLEGAIFGDHCSPISDTTVMSSIASASDHIDHVRTQAPYSVSTMAVALVFGYFPAAFFAGPGRGWLPWACLGLGAAVLTAFVLWKGEKVEAAEPAPAPAPTAP